MSEDPIGIKMANDLSKLNQLLELYAAKFTILETAAFFTQVDKFLELIAANFDDFEIHIDRRQSIETLFGLTRKMECEENDRTQNKTEEIERDP